MSAERTAGVEVGPPTVEVDVDLLDPSPTNRRTDFGDMKAFAETIREHGVISPITIRPAGKRFEIVCGERRWKGAKAAGLKTIPAVVRALLDDEAKEIQIVENLQREDVTPLGEAQGFADLRKLGLSVDDIAAKVGQTRSLVYARLKLLDLEAKPRKALEENKIDASVALLVARMPRALQGKALDELAKYHGGLEGLTARDAAHRLGSFQTPLSKAFFEPADSMLVKEAGACGPCPKRSGNAKELYPEIKDADVCTDPGCFARKAQAEFARRSGAPPHPKQDVQVISMTGKEPAGLVEASKRPPHVYEGPTWRGIVKKRLPIVAIALSTGGYDDPPGGTLLEFYDARDAAKLAPKRKPDRFLRHDKAEAARRTKEKKARKALEARVKLARPALLAAAKKAPKALRKIPEGLLRLALEEYSEPTPLAITTEALNRLGAHWGTRDAGDLVVLGRALGVDVGKLERDAAKAAKAKAPKGGKARGAR